MAQQPIVSVSNQARLVAFNINTPFALSNALSSSLWKAEEERQFNHASIFTFVTHFDFFFQTSFHLKTFVLESIVPRHFNNILSLWKFGTK